MDNPHVWFYLNVKNDKGEVGTGASEWAAERAQGEGWTRNTIKIGDEFIVEGSSQDGNRNVNSKLVTVAKTGQKLGAASSQGRATGDLP